MPCDSVKCVICNAFGLATYVVDERRGLNGMQNKTSCKAKWYVCIPPT